MILENLQKCKLIVLYGIMFGSIACTSTNEVQELESTITQLESRLAQYQQQSSQQNTKVDIATTQALRTQEGVETMLQQIANRLAVLEQQSNTMQLQVNRLEEYSSETATLSQRVQENLIDTSNRVDLFQNNLIKFNEDLLDLKTIVEASHQRDQQRFEALSSQLNSKINTLERSMNQAVVQIKSQSSSSQTQRQSPRPQQPTQSSTAASAQPASSSPTTSNSPTENLSGDYHIVQVGDKLSEIALRYNTTMEAIQQLNGLDNPNHIMVDQKLKIPTQQN